MSEQSDGTATALVELLVQARAVPTSLDEQLIRLALHMLGEGLNLRRDAQERFPRTAWEKSYMGFAKAESVAAPYDKKIIPALRTELSAVRDRLKAELGKDAVVHSELLTRLRTMELLLDRFPDRVSQRIDLKGDEGLELALTLLRRRVTRSDGFDHITIWPPEKEGWSRVHVLCK